MTTKIGPVVYDISDSALRYVYAKLWKIDHQQFMRYGN